MRVYGVTGWKNNGKTTLVERLVTHLGARGLTVSTVKHTHHGFDIDAPGRDSDRHRKAGAQQVIVASRARWALISELRGQDEPPLDELLSQFAPCDLVLIEGYKEAPHPKIEVRREAAARGAPIAASNASIRAIAADTALEGSGVPVFDLDDIRGIANFILADLDMHRWL